MSDIKQPIALAHVKRLSVKPGDALLVELTAPVLAEHVEHVRRELEDMLPGVRVLMHDGAIRLRVVAPADELQRDLTAHAASLSPPT